MLTAGIDEAGRGPLAGPVVAGAVILDPQRPIEGLGDSKQISPGKREALYEEIISCALGVGIGRAERAEIDRLNILQATMAAMQRAVDELRPAPGHLLIDGQHITLLHPSQETIIKGDAKVAAIGAASIIAKVTRDRLMLQYHKIFPRYGFDHHKGYGTAGHMQALRLYGATPIHRQSFSPVREHLPTWKLHKSKEALGLLGEQMAAVYLVEAGYTIHDLRYKVAHTGELDIIAGMDNMVVFVEVKSQVPGGWSSGEGRIDAHKRDRIMATAQRYCGEKGIDSAVRFDVISVTFTKTGPDIRHIKSGIHAD